MSAFEPYLPLNVPKPFIEGVWIVDGPEIRMNYGPVALPFPTRMVVVQLADGDLWLHSPIAPDPDLFDAVDRLGTVKYLVAPNSIHYWYMVDWLDRYPEAISFAVPDLQRKAKRPFRIDHLLDDGNRFDWQDEIDWLLVPGTVVTEAVFYVRTASVVVLTDLIENFELQRIKGRWHGLLARLGGADGGTPHDLRMTFWPKRRQVAEQIRRMLEWQPCKVIMAHGRPYTEHGAVELERAFSWAVQG